MYLIAEFHHKDPLTRAIRTLREAGTPVADLDVFSGEPVELPRGVLDRSSRMSLLAVTGAVLGCILATSFVYFAQYNYRVDTGGMPVFSFWGTGVITYEMTLLGSIIATFLVFLWESGLIRRHDKTVPIPSVPLGSICLRVRCPADRVVETSKLLGQAGAIGILEREVG